MCEARLNQQSFASYQIVHKYAYQKLIQYKSRYVCIMMLSSAAY